MSDIQQALSVGVLRLWFYYLKIFSQEKQLKLDAFYFQDLLYLIPKSVLTRWWSLPAASAVQVVPAFDLAWINCTCFVVWTAAPHATLPARPPRVPIKSQPFQTQLVAMLIQTLLLLLYLDFLCLIPGFLLKANFVPGSLTLYPDLIIILFYGTECCPLIASHRMAYWCK